MFTECQATEAVALRHINTRQIEHKLGLRALDHEREVLSQALEIRRIADTVRKRDIATRRWLLQREVFLAV